MALANVALALALLASILWRVQARRAGEDLLGPFRRLSPLDASVGLFVLLSVLSCSLLDRRAAAPSGRSRAS